MGPSKETPSMDIETAVTERYAAARRDPRETKGRDHGVTTDPAGPCCGGDEPCC